MGGAGASKSFVELSREASAGVIWSSEYKCLMRSMNVGKKFNCYYLHKNMVFLQIKAGVFITFPT